MALRIATRHLPSSASAVVVVAHPDDEVLWCGGFVLAHPEWRWRIVTLCRASDADRAPKFLEALRQLNATGTMADLDDGPEQASLDPAMVGNTVSDLLLRKPYDLVLTHGPQGEYTRHRRHEECCRAVVELWAAGLVLTKRLWLFAYEDGGRTRLPRAERNAHLRMPLKADLRLGKQRLIERAYGFQPDSWEARANPGEEAFWCFDSPVAAADFLTNHQPQMP